MANKTKNSKLNGKMKRRMRKTTAVVLLITSLVVAAIPVPDVTAAAESDYETNINEPENYDGYHVTEDLTTTYSIVPEVTGDDLIFCSQDGKFQFAYVENVTPKASCVKMWWCYFDVCTIYRFLIHRLETFKRSVYRVDIMLFT